MNFKDFLEQKGIERTEKFNNCVIKVFDNMIKNSFPDKKYQYLLLERDNLKLEAINGLERKIYNDFNEILEDILKYEKLYPFI